LDLWIVFRSLKYFASINRQLRFVPYTASSVSTTYNHT
jgi:hypothetical protein